MSQLAHACNTILNQLSEIVNQLNDTEFKQPSDTLSGSTIGQHLRHTIEFFISLESGCEIGVINYDRRAHNKLIETDKEMALRAINRIREFINTENQDRPLNLEVGYDLDSDDHITVQTNYYRELIYNIEHAVHHMAIMKIGIREVAPRVSIPSDFGIASSTLRYRRQVPSY